MATFFIFIFKKFNHETQESHENKKPAGTEASG